MTAGTSLPHSPRLRFGVQSIHRRTEPAEAPWRPLIEDLAALIEVVDRCGYDSIWVGDHVAFAIPYLDPLVQLAQAAVLSRRITVGTAVYLLPLRNPGPVAKQVATLDLLTEGRVIFGVGVGGEFPKEYELCGVPLKERGSRLNESIEVLRKLWSGQPVSHSGRHFNFTDIRMLPAPHQAGGPPIWCGGRSAAALTRAALLGDGWVSYAVTAPMFAEAMAKIRSTAEAARRDLRGFSTAHLLFVRVDDSYESAFAAANQTLSVRYGTDFSKPTRRYAALGPPRQVADQIRTFYEAGARHLILDFLGPYEERDRQITHFATEVIPLLKDLTGRLPPAAR